MSVKAVIAGIAIAEDVLAMDLDELTRVASTDPLYNKLLNKIKSNTFAKTSALEDPDVRPFFNVRDRCSLYNNLIMYTFDDHTPRIVIPLKLQERVIKHLHAAHQGVTTILS